MTVNQLPFISTLTGENGVVEFLHRTAQKESRSAKVKTKKDERPPPAGPGFYCSYPRLLNVCEVKDLFEKINSTSRPRGRRGGQRRALIMSSGAENYSQIAHRAPALIA
ncbi:hypothetical protein EVAR_22051_1 [Eumeta japonica]|uniref:Uncharacterized protein n=1 Tax=Eumeta variegata TaxID=151549 RepID=A0A4C1UT05_EUMVA|nr:hypothetical protein EVAR_22051_1 [Eumeta japonica]